MIERPGWNSERLSQVSEKFRDYWLAKSGQSATKRDWFAVWRNWVREEREQVNGHGNGNMSEYQQMQVEKHKANKRFSEQLHGHQTHEREPIDITPDSTPAKRLDGPPF